MGRMGQNLFQNLILEISLHFRGPQNMACVPSLSQPHFSELTRQLYPSGLILFDCEFGPHSIWLFDECKSEQWEIPPRIVYCLLINKSFMGIKGASEEPRESLHGRQAMFALI